MREPKRSASRARFPAKLRDMVRKHPDVLRWDPAERTLIIKDRTRFSKNTTGIKWSSFRRQLSRYGFYKHFSGPQSYFGGTQNAGLVNGVFQQQSSPAAAAAGLA